MSLATQVLIGLLLGIATGLFFGEEAAVLEGGGNAFIRLLQMTVIPYVTVSLIASLGSLTLAEARKLGVRAGVLLLALWAIVIAIVVAVPLAYPSWETASFFTTTLVHQAPAFDFVSLYIPANPFEALANSVVPSVVVFSALLGIALMSTPGKEPVIRALSVLADALMTINRLVAKLTPLGVFAITASAAGTMSLEELARLQVHLWVYASLALVLTFWVLPGLVAALTPVRYGQLFLWARAPLLLAFATGSLLIVLPMLVDRARLILAASELDDDECEATVEVIVPASFNFPSVGKLLTLSFVLFGGWLTGSSVGPEQMPKFLVAGVASFFGQVVTALPYLLDLMRLPSDLLQIYVVMGVVTGRLSTMMAAMHTLVLAVLGTYAMLAPQTLRWHRLIPWAGLSVGALAATILGLRVGLTFLLNPEYTEYQTFIQMDLPGDAVVVHHSGESPTPLDESDRERSRLAVILERGEIRVCYFPDALPFAFQNAAGRLVGFDVAMAHQLAGDMGVSLEFSKVERRELADRLKSGLCDIAMSGIGMTTDRALNVAYATSHLTATLGFAVHDHDRHAFSRWESVDEKGEVTIAMPPAPYFEALLQAKLPKAKFVYVDSVREFFQADEGVYDALAYSAESAAAWTLVYPSFTVAVPVPDALEGLYAYPLPRNSPELLEYINVWIELKKHDGGIDGFYDYWILGEATGKQEPRWSVIRDVLHWVE